MLVHRKQIYVQYLSDKLTLTKAPGEAWLGKNKTLLKVYVLARQTDSNKIIYLSWLHDDRSASTSCQAKQWVYSTPGTLPGEVCGGLQVLLRLLPDCSHSRHCAIIPVKQTVIAINVSCTKKRSCTRNTFAVRLTQKMNVHSFGKITFAHCNLLMLLVGAYSVWNSDLDALKIHRYSSKNIMYNIHKRHHRK